jgi:hypothetical protein
MGTRFGLADAGARRGPGECVDGVVGEGEAEAGVVGAVVVDLKLEGLVELALEALGRLGDVDALENR